MNPTPDPQYPAPVLWRGPWTEPAPILTRGSAFVFVEEASRAVASALPFTDLAQLDILGNVPDYIRPHGHVLTSGRYVGAEAAEDDGEPFEEKMLRLTAQLAAQMAESARLDDQIRKNLEGLGYGF